jgi:D-arginine dehydrogenase
MEMAQDEGYQNLWVQGSALFIADEARLPELGALRTNLDQFASGIAMLGPEEMKAIIPVLKIGAEHAAAGLLDASVGKLDSNLMLQWYAGKIRQGGGTLDLNAEVLSIRWDGNRWNVDTPARSYSARTIVNAAGTWADEIAIAAGLRPIGLLPLRRTIIGFSPPEGMEIGGWPLVKTVAEDGFYMLPTGGKLLASPMDVEPIQPSDAQPDEYSVALAAWRIKEATTLKIDHIHTRWAGLRTFTRDGIPAVGYSPDAPNFFWLAGQGGFGLQTSPALADAAASMLLRRPWPSSLSCRGIRSEDFGPGRFSIDRPRS